MRNSTKGALYSGLIFPGLGQIVLKRYQRGSIIMIAVLVSMFIFIDKAVGEALAIVNNTQLTGGAISMDSISDAASQVSATSSDLVMNVTLVLVMICWILGSIDAYLIGRKMDAQQTSTN